MMRALLLLLSAAGLHAQVVQVPTLPRTLVPIQLAAPRVAPSVSSPLSLALSPLTRVFGVPLAPRPVVRAVAAMAAPSPQGPGSKIDAFARRAEQLFHGGRLAPGQHGAVIYGPPAQGTEATPTDEEMQKRMAISPLTNPEREKVAIQLFQESGARYDPVRSKVERPDFSRDGEVQVQEAGETGKHNIFVVKKGKSDRVIILGSHVDKVSQGAGTIDNWTGTTMDINAYMHMKDVDTDATYVFVTFAREEEGLLGSQHFLDSLSPEQRKQIVAMVNLDTLAVNGTFSWKNNSTRSLLDLIRRTADREKLDLLESYLNGGDADSSTFKRVGIPAMTVFGASEDVIFDIIHSGNDTMASFSLAHYKNAYLLVVALLKEMDHAVLN